MNEGEMGCDFCNHGEAEFFVVLGTLGDKMEEDWENDRYYLCSACMSRLDRELAEAADE